MFQRYIAIDRYMNIRAKTGNASTQPNSFKGHSGQPRAMIFCVLSPYTANEPFSHHAVKSRQLVTI